MFDSSTASQGSPSYAHEQCPQCHSSKTVLRNRATRIGAALGAAAGASSSISAAAKGVHLGVSLSPPIGTPQMPINGLTAAIFAALTGAAIGSVTGARLGRALDKLVLNNYQCLSCGFTFQAAR